MMSHYAPDLPVRLNADTVVQDEALLAFGTPLPGARCLFQLSCAGDTIAGCSWGCAGWMRKVPGLGQGGSR
jgi:L-threonylcarbamoyladenylate synthase